MRKNLLLTCLLTLVAAFGMAQETVKFPITLTKADGLPGPRIVQNFVYKSEVFNLEEAVSVLRFTVCSTNTVDSLTEGSTDGFSAGWGSGIPFFTMSEFRIYDGDGNELEYIANCNAVQGDDGGGVAALNDKNEGTYLHTTYSNGGTFPHAWHYMEFELAQPVSSFSFSWNTRSGQFKNLPTYVGITPGTDYLPFPEQEFQLGEQVTDASAFAEEGALFVIRSNNPEDFYYDPSGTNRLVPRQLFYHAPYGGTETASSAALVYLTPDAENPNAYKVCWLNNGHYIIDAKYQSDTEAPFNIWLQWTNNILKAGSIEFVPCDTVEGDFALQMHDGAYTLAMDGLGKMRVCDDPAASIAEASRPYTFHMSVYKASINGAAIAAQLQAEIDEAEARIAAVGGKVPNYDEGEYEALEAAVAEAKELVANAEVSAAEILNAKRSLNRLTAAYAAVGLWAYIDSITVIGEMVDDEVITLCEGPNWENGAYNQGAFDALQIVSDNIQLVIEKCESLADVDAAINDIYEAIAAFWASKVTGVKELPFRIGSADDGLPGYKDNANVAWVWESPMWLLTEPVDAIRLTVFKTHSARNLNGKPFVCINEIEIYDQDGNKVPLTAESFYTPSIANEGNGLAGLVDGGLKTDTKTHFHSQWGADEDYDGSEYFYLDITLPYEISGFKYKQWGRGNGYDDVPTDFVFGYASETITPEDITFPDPYNAKVGEQITDASQITDDGLYTLVGLINCAPEGDGSGYEKFYSSNKVYGKTIGSPCAFTITKTGDEDGTFYIRSLADSKYWSRTIDDDGWGAVDPTSDFAQAGKFHIVLNAEARVAAEKAEYPNSFAIYMFNDTVKRNDEPHPYIVVQDWGANTGYFSIPTLADNDFDGEGEWFIYKMTMDNPYIYWLKSVYAAAAANSLQVGPDPGFYSEASAGEFAKALTIAQAALEANDNEIAKQGLLALEAASDVASKAELNPMVAGKYVIESSYAAYFEQQGVTKAVCSYYNDFENEGATSEYSLMWTDGPTDLANPAIYFQFEFISAANSEKVQIWLEDSVITAEDAANAYYIKSVEVGQYAGVASVNDDSGIPARSRDIGFTANPEWPYIVRPQGAYKYNLWCPVGPNNCFHMESHGGGGGVCGDIVHWSGGTVDASCWTLRSIDARTTSIGNLTVEPEGDVVSTSYYTVAGAAVPAPVKGINIVKKVYANGAVETSKIYVK